MAADSDQPGAPGSTESPPSDHDFPSPGHPLPPSGIGSPPRPQGVEQRPGSAGREQEIKMMIAEVMRQFASPLRGYKVVLFGSRASGKARPRSDFDIGVIGDEPLPMEVFYEIDTMLDELPTLYRIDWVDLNKAAPSLRARALANTEVIYE